MATLTVLCWNTRTNHQQGSQGLPTACVAWDISVWPPQTCAPPPGVSPRCLGRWGGGRHPCPTQRTSPWRCAWRSLRLTAAPGRVTPGPGGSRRESSPSQTLAAVWIAPGKIVYTIYSSFLLFTCTCLWHGVNGHELPQCQYVQAAWK